MEPLHAVLLGLIQGLAEFLPISSSGHLLLTPLLFGWEDQSLAFDVAVHFGTLAAVAVYFRADVLKMLNSGSRTLLGGPLDAEARLAWGLILATIPAAIVGYVLRSVLDIEFSSPLLVAGNLIVFGLLLGWADRRGRGNRQVGELRWRDFLLVGVAQALALSPGTSRSGITMTAALALGLNRVAAARLSFLMALPVILLATVYELGKLILSGAPAYWAEMAIGTAVAFVSGIVCIHFLLRLLQRYSFLPFVVYRLILGSVLVLLFA